VELTSQEIVALTKAFNTKAVSLAKQDIDNNSEIDVNLIVKVAGKLKRGQRSKPVKATSTIPWKVALALFAKRSGFTREQTAKVLLEAVTFALETNSDKQNKLLQEMGVGDAMAMLDREVFDKLPKKQRDGNVTFEVAVVEAVREPMLVADQDILFLGEGEEVAK
jgi:hypothetical protein|tara:strand:+ start:2100 stop:2594 length:495 start_codon:yes stop_codon:yes gene_type:complete